MDGWANGGVNEMGTKWEQKGKEQSQTNGEERGKERERKKACSGLWGRRGSLSALAGLFKAFL